MFRLYFKGNNSPSHPFELPSTVPPELASAFSEVSYLEHVEDCLEVSRWRPWEVRVSNLLRMIFHPLALVFERSRRAAHAHRLKRLHADMDHHFLRNTRARALGDGAVFGYSKDHTLAWLDILGSESDVATEMANIGQPRLPAVIPCTGDGSFTNPFHIELTDVLNTSLLTLVAPDFPSVVLGLNNALRSFRGPKLIPGLAGRKKNEDGSSALMKAAGLLDLERPDASSESEYAMLSGSMQGARSTLLEDQASQAGDGAASTATAPVKGKKRKQRKACCSIRGANDCPAIEDQQYAMHYVQYYLQQVNDVLQRRRRVALDAIAALERHQQQAQASQQQSSSSGQGGGGAHRRVVSLTFEGGVASHAAVAAELEARVEAALRLVSFGFPDFEAALHLGVMDDDGGSSRPCIVLLPANRVEGVDPLYLPMGVRLLAPQRPKWLAPFVPAVGSTSGFDLGLQDNGESGSAPYAVSALDDFPAPISAGYSVGANGSTRPSRPRTTCMTYCGCLKEFEFLYRYLPNLQSARASMSLETATCFLHFLLLLEALGTSVLIAGLVTLQSQLAVVFIVLPPFMTIISPIVGHIALGTVDPTWQRLHASATVVSLVPTLLIALIGCIMAMRGPLDVYLGVVVTIGLLVIKILIVHVLNARIALTDLVRGAKEVAYVGPIVAHVRTLTQSQGASTDGPFAAVSDDRL